MSERTLDAPLSGAEVIDAILDKIRTMLQNDCYLSPMTAYESFNAEIALRVQMTDCGRMPEVQLRTQVHSEAEVDEDAALAEAEAHLYDRPPNEVRQEAGLPIPTLVVDAEGKKDIKPVHYARKTQVVRSTMDVKPEL